MSYLFLPGLIYLALVAGGVLPFLAENETHVAVRGLLILGILTAFMGNKLPDRTVKTALGYFLVGALLTLPLLVVTAMPLYGAQKIESVVLGSLICYLLIEMVIARHRWDGYCTRAVYFAALVLLLTILYKARFGFWDREVRFFLNGPIVFGWLMGMHALFAIMLWMAGRGSRFGILAILFMLAVVWTQSKGPLLALGVSSFYLFVRMRKSSPGAFRKVIVGLFILITLVIANSDAVLEAVGGSRLQALAALVTGETQENDEGSIGSRGEMLAEAVQFMGRTVPFGIGIGEWQNWSRSGLEYPHNQHVEILVEMGIPWFLVHVAFVLMGFIRAGWQIRAVLIFFMVASTFSGDVSYLRYLYPFLLISLTKHGFRSARTPPRRSDETAWARS